MTGAGSASVRVAREASASGASATRSRAHWLNDPGFQAVRPLTGSVCQTKIFSRSELRQRTCPIGVTAMSPDRAPGRTGVPRSAN